MASTVRATLRWLLGLDGPTTARDASEPVHALTADNVPRCFRPDAYFNCPPGSLHQSFLGAHDHVFAVLDALHEYAVGWLERQVLESNAAANIEPLPPHVVVVGDPSACRVLQDTPDGTSFCAEKLISRPKDSGSAPMIHCLVLAKGAQVLGGSFDLSKGSIYVGPGAVIEPGVAIVGPTIIGPGCVVRFGAYLRGDVVLGAQVVVRAELKHVLILDQAQVGHPGYCGDSLVGRRAHLGNQVSTANCPLLHRRRNLRLQVHGTRYDAGRRKVGVILGDDAQLGCGVVTDPGTLVGRQTVVYPLTRVTKGVYPPKCLIKNKPMEKGVVDIVPMKPNLDGVNTHSLTAH